LGNVISLISMPCFMSHASIPAEVRAARGLPDDLVRISVGIEDCADLIADLNQAMEKAAAYKQQQQHDSNSSNGSRSSTKLPSPPSSIHTANGSSSTDALLAAAHSREQELVQRIQQLEAQLAHQNGAAPVSLQR